jgi:hypothetical protein
MNILFRYLTFLKKVFFSWGVLPPCSPYGQAPLGSRLFFFFTEERNFKLLLGYRLCSMRINVFFLLVPADKFQNVRHDCFIPDLIYLSFMILYHTKFQASLNITVVIIIIIICYLKVKMYLIVKFVIHTQYTPSFNV